MTKNKESRKEQEPATISEQNGEVDTGKERRNKCWFRNVRVWSFLPRYEFARDYHYLDSSITSSKAGNTEVTETDFPYEGDSILVRGPSARFSRRHSLRESQVSLGKDMPMANTMNATWSSLHSILEDTEIAAQNAPISGRGSMRKQICCFSYSCSNELFHYAKFKTQKIGKT